MAHLVTIDLNLLVEEGHREAHVREERVAFTSSVLKREVVTISATTFQALSPPTGAAAALIYPGASVSLTLKGVTGDTGIACAPTSLPKEIPLLIPLGASPSIGVYNGHSASQSLTVVWL